MPHTKTKSDNDAAASRSAKAQKAEEVQQAGSAKAGAGHPPVPEGGPPPPTKLADGHPAPAASRAHAERNVEEGTSPATAGQAEKAAAAKNAELTKDQHGRGRRKAE